jgi:hypothetical protein
VCVALRWATVETDALGELLQELRGEANVGIDHAPDEELVLHREIRTYVVEK